VGLNAVWIVISLLLGAKLGGVLGLIVAVPLAGATKRIIDFKITDQNMCSNS